MNIQTNVVYVYVCFHVGFFVGEIDSGVMENNETQIFLAPKPTLFGPKAAFSEHKNI